MVAAVTAHDAPLMVGTFAVIDGVTYKVTVLDAETLRVFTDANDRSGTWQPDRSRWPVKEDRACGDASRIYGVRVFAKWRGVGVRVTRIHYNRAEYPEGQVDVFYTPIDLEVYGPRDWPRPVRSRVPPHDGLRSTRVVGSDPPDEFAGGTSLDELTDIRQTEVAFPRGEHGNLHRRPLFFL